LRYIALLLAEKLYIGPRPPRQLTRDSWKEVPLILVCGVLEERLKNYLTFVLGHLSLDIWINTGSLPIVEANKTRMETTKPAWWLEKSTN